MEELLEVRRDQRNHKKQNLALYESVYTRIYGFKIKELHRFFLPESNKHIAYCRVSSGVVSELVISKRCTDSNLINWLMELSNTTKVRIGGF